MTSPEDKSVSWRAIGPVLELSKKKCRLIHSSDGRDADVCLFYVRGEFFAMDARCAHSGGPLCDGDIEEADVLQVFCPWHDYDFNLKTGKSSTGLQQTLTRMKSQMNNSIIPQVSPAPVPRVSVISPRGVTLYVS
ncbi:Rieske domain-containing protein isoform X1 [Misgurnus anguillicaudatus]|uniref:Rieske domain-containing protein isoform X1 n=1 Tax=Misgurnus anguillicaudatus TaxID=75329 RepID=UPI0024351856|nr:Rieske domain-containing protein isoform X1 [Misgurnus anguillicaudatus]